jgi:hypothetical protein
MTTTVAAISPVAATAALTVTTPSTTAAAERSASAAAFRFRTRFVHIQRPTTELSTVQGCDRPLSLSLIRHFNKRESAGPARVAIRLYADPLDLAVRFK